MAPEEHTYHAQDAIAIGTNSTLVMGGVGTFVSAIQNTLTRENIGPMKIFTRTGTTIAVFGTHTMLSKSERGEEADGVS